MQRLPYDCWENLIALHWENLIALHRDSSTYLINIYLCYKMNSQNCFSETNSLDQLIKSQKLLKWTNVCLGKIFKVAPVEEIYSWTQTIQGAVVAKSLFCTRAWVKEKISSRATSRIIAKAVIHIITKTTAVIATRPMLCKRPK